VDDTYRCRYLVGAGGTYCPVYKTFFADRYPRSARHLISTVEIEYAFNVRDEKCYLWFFENRLPGYAWYVPKKDGFLNIGMGGKLLAMKSRGKTIRRYWDDFSQKLGRLGLICQQEQQLQGWNYYIRQQHGILRWGNAFVVGDAAGLATLDMGEGIRPAVQSGIMVARTISEGIDYSHATIGKYSFPDILFL
jgi:flavin-dependent dehydrogenase